MSFEDKLRAAITDGISDRKGEEAEQERFYSHWLQLRPEVVALLQRAAVILAPHAAAATADVDNGGAYLRVEAPTGLTYSLTFAPDKPRREVLCATNPEVLPAQHLPLEGLSQSAAEGKVIEFAYTLGKLPRSNSWGDGVLRGALDRTPG